MENLNGYDVYFEDAQQGLSILLSEDVQIPFELTEGEHGGRFFLRMVPQELTGIQDVAGRMDLQVYSSGNETLLTLNGNPEAGTIEVFDVNGQLQFAEQSVTLSAAPYVLHTEHLAAAIYLVRFTTENGHSVKRFSKF